MQKRGDRIDCLKRAHDNKLGLYGRAQRLGAVAGDPEGLEDFLGRPFPRGLRKGALGDQRLKRRLTLRDRGDGCLPPRLDASQRPCFVGARAICPRRRFFAEGSAQSSR